MRKLCVGLFTALALIAMPAAANAASCKDAKGKFVKCPPAAAVASKASVKKEAAATSKMAAAATKMAAAAKKGAPATTAMAAKKPGTVQRCRNAKGQFAKCGTPGSKPA